MRMIDADELFINLDGIMAVSPTGYIHGDTVADMISDAPTVDAIPVVWIKEWVEEIKDHPAYTEEEKTLCIEEFEDMLGAWAERKD